MEVETTLPLVVDSNPTRPAFCLTTKELGLAFMPSILIDALLVHTYLAPAVVQVVGKSSWFGPNKQPRC